MINTIENGIQKTVNKNKKYKIKCIKNSIINVDDILSNSFCKINISDNSISNDNNITNDNIITSDNIICNDNSISNNNNIISETLLYDDKYYKEILINRFSNFKQFYMSDVKLIHNGLPIRHQNTPEDITENITKFIIRKYENDNSCVWCKGVDKKYSLIGDLYSNKYDIKYPIEVKSFTSIGPSQFGPNKKFGVLYFLDLRKWLNNEIILWKVNLNSNSNEYKNIKVSKTETIFDQINKGRRPHISWDKIYPQIKEYSQQIYKGTFEDIF